MNITMVAEMAAAAMGERIAIVDRDQEVSYTELAARVQRRAAGVSEIASRTGAGHVAYLGLSGTAFIEHMLGAAWAGLPFIPLNYRGKGEELAPLLDPFAPVVLVHDPEYAALAEACSGPKVALATTAETASATPIDTPYPVDPDQLAVILFTSGTTSAPKAVLLRSTHLCSYIFGVIDLAAAAPDETALVTTPPYHIAGIMGLLTPLYTGRRMVFLPRFDPRMWLETARAHAVTHAFVVPTMLARIVDALESDPSLQPQALRHVAYGGGPIHLSLVERALRLLPDVDFVNAYGLTETSSTVALLSPQDHRMALSSDDPIVKARLGSVGRPLPGIEVVILDEDGAELPAGERGTIAISGPQVSAQYHGQDATTQGGRFVTSDIGYVDRDGYIFIGGRSDDVIIRGGENISPGEIEEVFSRHPDVRAIGVVGAPDEEWGERIVAFVEPRNEGLLSPDELREWARATGHLAGFKIPESFVFVPELPRTDTGKLLRTQLRQMLTS